MPLDVTAHSYLDFVPPQIPSNDIMNESINHRDKITWIIFYKKSSNKIRLVVPPTETLHFHLLPTSFAYRPRPSTRIILALR